MHTADTPTIGVGAGATAPLAQFEFPKDLNLPSLRLPFSVGGQSEGVAVVLKDECGLPKRIELIHRAATDEVCSPTGYFIEIPQGPLRAQCSATVRSLQNSDTTLELIVDLLKSMRVEASARGVPPPIVMRVGAMVIDFPLTQDPASSPVQYFRSLLPESIELWQAGHRQVHSTVARYDQQGSLQAIVSVGTTSYPSSGALLSVVVIVDYRKDQLQPRIRRHNYIDRTKSDAALRLQGLEESFNLLRSKEYERFLDHEVAGTTNDGGSHSTKSSVNCDHGTVATRAFLVPPPQGRMVSSLGVVLAWHTPHAKLELMISPTAKSGAAILIFSQRLGSADPRFLGELIDAVCLHSNTKSAIGLLEQHFTLTQIRSYGRCSLRLLPLITGVAHDIKLTQLQSSTPLGDDFTHTEQIEATLGGYELVGFRDLRYGNSDPRLASRLAHTIFFRLWEGGCSGIYLFGSGQRKLSILPKGTAFPQSCGAIPALRTFLSEQLHLFSEEPFSLVKWHVAHESVISPYLEKELNNVRVTVAEFLSRFLRADLNAEERLFEYKTLYEILYNSGFTYGSTYRLALNEDKRFMVVLALDGRGADTVRVLQRCNPILNFLRAGFRRCIGTYPVPDTLRREPERLRLVLSALVQALSSLEDSPLSDRAMAKLVKSRMRNTLSGPE